MLGQVPTIPPTGAVRRRLVFDGELPIWVIATRPPPVILGRYLTFGDPLGREPLSLVGNRNTHPPMNILVLDIGGTNIKLCTSDQPEVVKIPSGLEMTAAKMVAAVTGATAGWKIEAVAIGYPGPVSGGRIVSEPHNLGSGWVDMDFEKAFGCPVRIVNDAAMQALGSYNGGRMLFLGLGTGLGSALIENGVLVQLELAHLPYKNGKTYEEFLGIAGLERLGKKKWRRHVGKVVALLKAAMVADYVVLGGGNSKVLKTFPPGTHTGDNANAFHGGFRVWEDSPIP